MEGNINILSNIGGKYFYKTVRLIVLLVILPIIGIVLFLIFYDPILLLKIINSF